MRPAVLVVLEVRTGLAVPVVEEAEDPDLAWCKEAAEQSSSLAAREEAVLAEEGAAADCFAKPSIGFGLAFTIAMKIRHSMPGHIR